MRDLSPGPVTALGLALSVAAGLVACGHDAAVSPSLAAAPPVQLVIGEPAPALVPPPDAPTLATREPAPAPEPEELPRTWSAPIVPGLGFADAIRKARSARDTLERLPPPSTNVSEPALKAWFTRMQLLADQASRSYAGAFHAKDAPREGRVDAIAEAAALDMTMARALDEQNLGSMPMAWRSDPAVAGTFEDVDVGPTRRWRAEARVLARQCVDTARELAVLTDAARRCEALRLGMPLKRVVLNADAGAGCACSPGDPLCSASLGGWCATHAN